MLRYLVKSLLIFALLFALQPKAMACRRHRDIDRLAFANDEQGQCRFVNNDCPFNVYADVSGGQHPTIFKSPVPGGDLIAQDNTQHNFKSCDDLFTVKASNTSNLPYRRQLLFPFHGFW